MDGGSSTLCRRIQFNMYNDIMKSFNTENSSTTDIASACSKTLKTPGTVLLVPTETVYGLICDWEDESGRNRIYELKQR